MTFSTRTTYTQKPVRLAIQSWGAADQCTMSQVPISYLILSILSHLILSHFISSYLSYLTLEVHQTFDYRCLGNALTFQCEEMVLNANVYLYFLKKIGTQRVTWFRGVNWCREPIQNHTPDISDLDGNVFITKVISWWRQQMETFSALLAFCAGNSAVTGEFRAQRPVTRSFDAFFHLSLNKRLSKQC